MLYAGLGWKRANRLPGYCGNMFIPSEVLKETLIDIEQIFAEVDEEDFLARANAIGSRGNCNEDIPTQLLEFPLAIDKALTEGNGFLALNYSHWGSLTLLDEEDDEDYKLLK